MLVVAYFPLVFPKPPYRPTQRLLWASSISYTSANRQICVIDALEALMRLNECFLPERAAQIYTHGLILCANGFVHLDQIDEFYQESIMSLQYSRYSFKMGYSALANLLHDLGMKGNPVRKS